MKIKISIAIFFIIATIPVYAEKPLTLKLQPMVVMDIKSINPENGSALTVTHDVENDILSMVSYPELGTGFIMSYRRDGVEEEWYLWKIGAQQDGFPIGCFLFFNSEGRPDYLITSIESVKYMDEPEYMRKQYPSWATLSATVYYYDGDGHISRSAICAFENNGFFMNKFKEIEEVDW